MTIVSNNHTAQNDPQQFVEIVVNRFLLSFRRRNCQNEADTDDVLQDFALIWERNYSLVPFAWFYFIYGMAVAQYFGCETPRYKKRRGLNAWLA